MKYIYAIIISVLAPIAAMAQQVIYEKEDSTRIEEILRHISQEKRADTGELLISIANKFTGEKYVGATLEQGIGEPMFISCSKLDCTTFVELVLAIARTANEGCTGFNDVCRNLERLRYRNGKNEGYTSRLHYISWWITDKAKEGLIEEITPQISNHEQLLNLYFMSSNADKYPLLSNHPKLIEEIEKQEMPYRNIKVNYIPKETISPTGGSGIKNGDIIAITTSTPGLDVTHIGFACYSDGELRLLHASSGKGTVLKETESLRNYLAGKKRHTGIRVFRAQF